MNNWKDYPSIFANGKFQGLFRKRGENHVGVINGYRKIKGLKPEYRFDAGLDGIEWICIYGCTLIARKIEDMSDEECRQVAGFDDITIKKIREYLEAGSIADIKIPMLSIGVYPFDQSHFGKSVIDIKEVS